MLNVNVVLSWLHKGLQYQILCVLCVFSLFLPQIRKKVLLLSFVQSDYTIKVSTHKLDVGLLKGTSAVNVKCIFPAGPGD